jgi:hypothetical protein
MPGSPSKNKKYPVRFPDMPDSWTTPQPPAAQSRRPNLPEILPGQTAVDSLRLVRRKKSRNYELAHQGEQLTLRGVPPEFQNKIRSIANDKNVRVDHVGRAFLEYGLNCYAKGKISLEARPNGRKFSLYSRDGWGQETPGWEEVTGWQARQEEPVAARKKKKAGEEAPKLWKIVMTIHDVPQQVKDEFNAIWQGAYVTKGELATALLGHSIRDYEAGRMRLKIVNPTSGAVECSE